MVLSGPSLSRLADRLMEPGRDVWRVHYDAQRRKDAGEDVILMSVGDPDFPTPDAITRHLVERIRANRTHYSPAAGEPELLSALAALETQSTGRPFVPSQFAVFPGATAALFTALSALLDPGDEILVPDPMYVGYTGLFTATNVRPVTVPLDLQRGGAISLERIKAAATSTTRALLVNTPGNPCGNVIDAQTLSQIARWCGDQNIWLIADEVYSLITFEQPHVSLLKCTTDLDSVVVIDGLSKSHAMSGWRVGWAVGGERAIDAMVAFSGAAFFGVSQFIQDGAAFALATNIAHVERMRAAYHERRDFMMPRLRRMGLDAIEPQGGMFVMVDVSSVSRDGESFADHLLQHAGVSVIPGRGFGETTSAYVRVSLTHDMATLDDALTRIENALPDIQRALANR